MAHIAIHFSLKRLPGLTPESEGMTNWEDDTVDIRNSSKDD